MSGEAYKRHKDAIGNFNKKYVKTEIFPRDIGRKIGEAEEIRHASDYDDFYIASKEETSRQISVAAEFIEMVEKYCRKYFENSAVKGLTQEELDVEIEKGYAEMQEGRTVPAQKAFSDIRKKYDL